MTDTNFELRQFGTWRSSRRSFTTGHSRDSRTPFDTILMFLPQHAITALLLPVLLAILQVRWDRLSRCWSVSTQFYVRRFAWKMMSSAIWWISSGTDCWTRGLIQRISASLFQNQFRVVFRY